MTKKVLILILASIVALGLITLWLFSLRTVSKEPIRIGILHSLTGTLAISELSVVDATLMAIAEINEQEKLLGRLIEPIVMDGKSDPNTFAELAEKLILEKEVSVVFGCWTSASRKSVRPVFEKHNHLLFYPVQYEGLESSPNIVYTGAAPNQQILPGVKWAADNLGKRFFLVGSDYVFPRAANAIITDAVKMWGGEVVGEEYILLGSRSVESIVEKIVASKPDVILNTINGDSNIAFFQSLRSQGIMPENIPTISFSIGEQELSYFDAATTAGDYAVWNYFQSLPSKTNTDFVKRFKQKYGEARVVTDPMEAAYFGVYLWAQAVTNAQTTEINEVRKNLAWQARGAPEGIVFLDQENQHTWKQIYVGKMMPTGQFNIVWSSEKAVAPEPYPKYLRSKEEWDQFLKSLFEMWGGAWAAQPT